MRIIVYSCQCWGLLVLDTPKFMNHCFGYFEGPGSSFARAAGWQRCSVEVQPGGAACWK